jgi:hypothetical protein
MSTRRQLVGLTLGSAAALSVGALAAAGQPLPTPSAPSVPPTSGPSPSGPPPSEPASQQPTSEPPPDEPSMTLTARRTELTLPSLPALGIPYVCLLDLFDETARQVGTATSGSLIVGVTLEGPVVLATVLLHLPDGEIHYQRLMNRFGGFPRTAVGAILGGTGAYRDARGEVGISWPDDEQVDLAVTLA